MICWLFNKECIYDTARYFTSSLRVTGGESVNLLLPCFILFSLTDENVHQKVMIPPRIPPIITGNLYSWALDIFLPPILAMVF